MAIVFLFCSSFVFGQSVKEFNAQLAEMKQSSDANVQEQATRLKSLSTDLHPTVYLSADATRTFGGSGSPVCAIATVGAVNKLYAEDPLFGQVELITIKLEMATDLSVSLNLSALSGFSNLKYIQILCEFNCTVAQVETIISGAKAGVVVCYLVSMPG